MIRLLKIAVSALLIGILAWNLDWTEFLADFLGMEPVLMAAGFILLWIQYPLSAIKWRKSLNLHGIDYPLGYLLRTHCIAFFFNNFLPTSIGGDAYRSYRTMENARRPAHAISAVVMERLIGLIALVFLGALCAAYLVYRDSLQHPGLVITGLALGLFGVLTALLLWKSGSHEKLWASLKNVQKLEPMIDSIRVINTNSRHFFGLVWMSVAYQAVAIYTISLLFASVRLPAAIAESGFTAAAAGVAGMLPISINGIGVVEGSFVVAALETGLPYEEALLVAVYLRAFMFLASVVFGILYALEPAESKVRPEALAEHQENNS